MIRLRIRIPLLAICPIQLARATSPMVGFLRNQRFPRLEPDALVRLQPQRRARSVRLRGDQVGDVIAWPVDPQLVAVHLLRLLREVRYNQHALAAGVAYVAEQMRVAGLHELRLAAPECRLLLAQADQAHKLGEDRAMRRGW